MTLKKWWLNPYTKPAPMKAPTNEQINNRTKQVDSQTKTATTNKPTNGFSFYTGPQWLHQFPVQCITFPLHKSLFFFYYWGHFLMETNNFWKHHLSHHNKSTIFHLSPTMFIPDDITHWKPNQQTGITAITADSNTNSSMCTQKTRRWQSGNI